MECIGIDGSRGEGGGQILRTAASLSCITGTPIHIENIRRGRKIPGLRPQHLAAIRLLARICDAKTDGLSAGSESLTFEPGAVQSMELEYDVGTAGSIPLVLQTVILPAAAAAKRLRLNIAGGTDVSWSPTMDYTRHVLSCAYSRMGVNFSAEVRARGYYPKGGGRVALEVHPSKDIVQVSLTERTGRIANLFCAYRGCREQALQAVRRLQEDVRHGGFEVNSYVREERAACSGGAVLVCSQDASSVVGADGLAGRDGFPSDVAGRFLDSSAVDSNLADMLVLPASIAGGTTIYRTSRITEHLKTVLYVASKMTGCRYGIGRLDGEYEVRISGNSDARVQ